MASGLDRRLKKRLEEVLSLPTAPFRESLVIEYLLYAAKELGLFAATDAHGNVRLEYSGPQPDSGDAPAGLVALAHLDHPGFEVTAVDELRFTAEWRGGIEPSYFEVAEDALGHALLCYADAHYTRGFVSGPLVKDDASGFRKFTAIAETTAPPVGAIGWFDVGIVRMRGERIHTKAADNLASVAAILAALERLASERAPGRLVGVFTRAEEVGFVGASLAVAGEFVPRDLPVVVLESSKVMTGAELGLGPVVRVGDRLSTFDARVEAWLTHTAERLLERDESFSYQRALMTGGACEASLLLACGYRVGCLAFPLENYHNHGPRGRPAAEAIGTADASRMVTLLTALAGSSADGELLAARAARFHERGAKLAKRLADNPFADAEINPTQAAPLLPHGGGVPFPDESRRVLAQRPPAFPPVDPGNPGDNGDLAGN